MAFGLCVGRPGAVSQKGSCQLGQPGQKMRLVEFAEGFQIYAARVRVKNPLYTNSIDVAVFAKNPSTLGYRSQYYFVYSLHLVVLLLAIQSLGLLLGQHNAD